MRSNALAATLFVLAGCGTRPPEAPQPPAEAAARSAPATARDAYEATLRARAVQATAERRWHDAVLAWELLSVLRPADAQVAAKFADCRQRATAAVAEVASGARQAERRGDVDTAARGWWAVLALDPTNGGAGAALRKIEGERHRRLYLGRHAAGTLTRRAVAEADAMPTARGGNPKASAAVGPTAVAAALLRPDLDPAVLLAADGEDEAAAELLETRLADDRGDVAARRLLVEVYRREADEAAPTDRPKARKALERAARLDR